MDNSAVFQVMGSSFESISVTGTCTGTGASSGVLFAGIMNIPLQRDFFVSGMV